MEYILNFIIIIIIKKKKTNKYVSVNDSFKLHSLTDTENQPKLNSMYEKLGFKRIGGEDTKPKYGMNVGEYLMKNK